jgi:hypothetical protein
LAVPALLLGSEIGTIKSKGAAKMKFRNLIEKCAWKEEVKRIQNVFD